MNPIIGKNRFTPSVMSIGEFLNDDGTTTPYVDVEVSLVAYEDGSAFVEYPERVPVKVRAYFFGRDGKPSDGWHEITKVFGNADPEAYTSASNFPGNYEGYLRSYKSKAGKDIYVLETKPPKRFTGMSSLKEKLGVPTSKPLPQTPAPVDEFKQRKAKLFNDWVAFYNQVEPDKRVAEFIEWCGIVDPNIVQTRTISTNEQIDKLFARLEQDKKSPEATPF